MCLLVGWALGVIETVILNTIHDQLKKQDIEHRLGYVLSFPLSKIVFVAFFFQVQKFLHKVFFEKVGSIFFFNVPLHDFLLFLAQI